MALLGWCGTDQGACGYRATLRSRSRVLLAARTGFLARMLAVGSSGDSVAHATTPLVLGRLPRASRRRALPATNLRRKYPSLYRTNELRFPHQSVVLQRDFRLGRFPALLAAGAFRNLLPEMAPDYEKIFRRSAHPAQPGAGRSAQPAAHETLRFRLPGYYLCVLLHPCQQTLGLSAAALSVRGLLAGGVFRMAESTA